jgi:deoxyhypusine synthase
MLHIRVHTRKSLLVVYNGGQSAARPTRANDLIKVKEPTKTIREISGDKTYIFPFR